MHQRTQDAMSYVRKFGRPSLFITMTCNPSWHEIKAELFEGQTANNRPDIVARVFNLKRKSLMDKITKRRIFGDVTADVCSIEWLKRGLPHAHILIWLAAKDKIYANSIDSLISAEIPDPVANPRLHKTVMSHMIHGPCGQINKNSPCMVDNCCNKNFPKDYALETTCTNDGYPLYRRRSPAEGGHTGAKMVKGKEFRIDNTWVVPYSPYLCDMFDCHINVEVCTSINAIKYVIKYINKGTDMAAFALTRKNPRDEVDVYQAARYVSCSEACWRLLGFSIHDRSPAVVTLQVHLPNGQRVLFNPQNAHGVAENPPNTTLTAYFDLCKSYTTPETREPTPDEQFVQQLLYSRVPEYFTLGNRKTWNARKKGKPVTITDNNGDDQPTSFKQSSAIGRIYAVHPKQDECFFVRLLLHNVKGYCSFEHLRTVDGEVKNTFREACRCRGLLEGDAHWIRAMEEAALHASASSLRVLFSILLTNCQLSDPVQIWNNHKDSMTDDVLHRCRMSTEQSGLTYTQAMYTEALIRLEDIVLQMSGKDLANFGLPPVQREGKRTPTVTFITMTQFFKDASHNLSNEILSETSYDVEQLRQFVSNKEGSLTDDQRKIYRRVIELIDTNEGGLLFIDAPGGTGNTYVANLALARIGSRRRIALAVASSGTAAQLLSNGRTAHSAFKIPLNLFATDEPMCSIKRGSATATLLRQCTAIFWDEATMMHKRALEAVNRTLKDIRKSEELFGGILMILSGDFCQTLPVVRGRCRPDEISACIKWSNVWQHVETHELTTNMRVHLHNDTNAAHFAQTLLTVGNGQVPYEANTHKTTIPSDLAKTTNDIDTLITSIYSDLHANCSNTTWLMERAILAPLNESVSRINGILLTKFPGETKTYYSVDSVKDVDDATLYPTEFLNSLDPAGLPPHTLTLKIGVPLMVVRNLAPGIANGTRLILTRIMEKCLETVIATGPKKGRQFFIPMIALTPTDTGLPFQFTRLQFPVKLCMAMTINKSQGQTLKVAGLYLEEPCFSHGQFYVGCSRVSASENLFTCTETKSTRNAVYKEVLQ